VTSLAGLEMVERFEGAALVLYLEGEEAEYYGPNVITTLPYFFGSKTQS
jgi:hypothetical protein